MYTIREYTQKDINKIVDFWLRNQYFKGVSSQILKKHLTWKYNKKFTKLWVAEKNKKIIGSCGMITYPLILEGNKIIRGDWGIDSLVDKEADSENKNFIFFRVFRKALFYDYRRKKPYLDFCFPNEVVKRTYLKVGWIDVPIFWKFTKEISYTFFEKINTNTSFTYRGVKFLSINKFEKTWNNLLKNLCSKYFLISIRDADYLNWRYFKCPTKKYFVFLGKKNSKIKGYLILRKESVEKKLHHGYITDLLVDPQDEQMFEIFINAALLFFKNKKTNFIHFYTSYKPYKHILLKLGFTPVRKIDFFVYGKDKKLLNIALNKSNFWYVTGGDGDFEME